MTIILLTVLLLFIVDYWNIFWNTIYKDYSLLTNIGVLILVICIFITFRSDSKPELITEIPKRIIVESIDNTFYNFPFLDYCELI